MLFTGRLGRSARGHRPAATGRRRRPVCVQTRAHRTRVCVSAANQFRSIGHEQHSGVNKPVAARCCNISYPCRPPHHHSYRSHRRPLPLFLFPSLPFTRSLPLFFFFYLFTVSHSFSVDLRTRIHFFSPAARRAQERRRRCDGGKILLKKKTNTPDRPNFVPPGPRAESVRAAATRRIGRKAKRC